MSRFSNPARTRRLTRSRLSRLVTLVLAAGGVAVLAVPARAAGPVNVVLEFDNNSVSQYTLAYQQALQPHSAKATFFVNSGTVSGGPAQMTWAQLSTIAAAGNDVGGKSVNATNLTTDPNPTAQVCNDRAAIISHGLTPVGFAYPGGATNATVQGIVKGCGYGNARGITSGTETLPPANWFATKAYAPGTVTLASMQSAVNSGAVNGGLVQLVIGRVCSQTLDSANYTSCSAASGHVELTDLSAFLDWMANAGQTGGAPANATLTRLSTVVGAADTSAPATTISCNAAACSSTPYPGVVSVTLAATDTGSGVASTHYTVDGSDPTQASPTYTGAFTVNGSSSSTTVKFRSWDYQGNAEPVQTQVIQAPTDGSAPSTSIACNGAACSNQAYVATVSVTLSASDTGGSGVAATYYTTDGSTPTTNSQTYNGAFSLNTPGSYTVKYFSTDNAGNAEQVQSQAISVVPVTTKVSLTFDNGTVGQYTLGWLQALKPHGDTASFYVNSGNVSVSTNIMSWAQLNDLAAAGNDIGGKTVSATNLTTDPNPTAQVCDDRTALVNHGLDPVGFAYPGGANNQTVRDIVKGCGYGVARSAGSLSPTGPTYAEKLPPTSWYATRAYAPSGQVTLANMKALVNGAAANSGGWSQIVITRVCSQALDPNGYSSCTTGSGWIELADLNSFLDWMGNAGQTGGAPAGAALSTVRDAAISADTIAPATTAACNGAPCDSGTYTQTVYVALSGTDVGSAIASTHYTTDGSTPTLNSPTYSQPIPITSTTTLTFRSWDHARNAEAPNSLVVNASLPPDGTAPTTTIACDGQPCTTSGYNGSTKVTLTADDGTGWGVDSTYYTTDGSAPTTSSTVYNGAFTLSTGTYTVSWFSTDLAGNTEQVQSQQIVVLPPKVIVSFTFDDGDASQYSLAYQRALKPHGMHGTFYVNTGNLASGPGFMTWQDLQTMSQGGEDVGGHTVDHIDLTSSAYTEQQKVDEVCNDRQALVGHGIDATSFAYPFGAYDATAQSIVQACGYSDARRTGGIATSGAPYSETIPPKDPYATITWTAPTPTTSPVQLSDMEDAVNTAAAHGGGWVQFVGHEICSQTYDASNYSSCMGSFRPTELSTLQAFMDWLQNPGQPGGAPARTQVKTVNEVINGPDTEAPSTTLTCNGSGCAPSSYAGSVTVAFKATDLGGSGVAGTYFTTDGSTPTTSSPAAGHAFTINSDTTFKFFSVDNAGNAEPVQTLTVQAAPRTDPVVGAAGDIACDPTQLAFNEGQGTATDCRAAHTAQLLEGVDAVLPLGDDQYNCGGTSAWQQAYDPTWGVLKSISRPVPGDADYATNGGTDCPTTPGAGYYQYFGAAAGDPSKGYYSYNLGQWHVVAINTAPCETNASACAAGSAQDQWLQQDLAANTSSCTLAYYQNPRFTSTAGGGNDFMQPIWQDLYNGGADVVLNGDSHWYERFAQVNAAGAIDPSFGVREFIVGTGGQGLDTPAQQLPISQVVDHSTHGVIKLTLHNGSYDWSFVPDEGTFTDSGSTNCHGKPTPADTAAPTTSITCAGSPCAGWYQGSTQVALSADDAGGSGVDKTYFTTDGSTPTTSSTLYTGPFTLASSATVRYFSVDKAGNQEGPKSQLVQVDAVAPTTSISCNGGSCSSGFYKGTVSVALSSTDTTGSGVAATYYTTDGSTPTTASTSYTGPIGITSTHTVTFFSVDNAGNAEAVKSQLVQIDSGVPSTTIACNGTTCSTGQYGAPVSVTLSATDTGGSGVAATYYTTDGSTPTTSSTRYAGAFVVSKISTVKYFSVDQAGNAETPKSQTLQVVLPTPTTTITCNSATCSAGWYTATVTVRLAATDVGGPGVAATYYTTDGSTPTTRSTRYSGAFTLTSTRTVKFFSVDKAGLAEAVKSQLIRIDSTAPTTTIACNGKSCSLKLYSSPVRVTLNATDASGGSGVSSTHYTTNGSTPSLSSPTYTGAFTVSATTIVQYRSWDVAGNVESVKSRTISVVGLLFLTSPTFRMP